MRQFVGFLLWITGSIFVLRTLWALSPGLVWLLVWCGVALFGMFLVGSSRT